MKREKAKKSYVRQLLAGGAIFAILVLHFAVSQFISFQSGADSPVAEAIDKPAVQSEAKQEVPKSDAVTIAPRERVIQVRQSESEVRVAPKQAVEKETVVKKKEPLESKSERLRRVEKFLTGS